MFRCPPCRNLLLWILVSLSFPLCFLFCSFLTFWVLDDDPVEATDNSKQVPVAPDLGAAGSDPAGKAASETTPIDKDKKRKRRKSPISSSTVDSDSDLSEQDAKPKKKKKKKKPKPPWHPKPPSAKNFLHLGNSAENPINVDSCPLLLEPALGQDYVKKEEISLGSHAPPPKIKSTQSYVAWDAYGHKETFSPEFHYPIYHTRMERFMTKLTSGFINDQPPFLSSPELSLFKLIPYSSFISMDAPTLQGLMSEKHVVVTDIPFNKGRKFDEDAMRTLIGSLSCQVSINDFSVPPTNGDDCSLATIVSGYASDILTNAMNNGRILNGLDFPMGDADRRPNKYAVDLDAWDVTRGQHRIPLASSYPMEHMRWGAAATKDPFTFLHIDCDGLNMNDGPICRSLSSIYFFVDKEKFCLDDVPPATEYKFEGIVLRSTDMLYVFMKPSTPHFVYGITAAVCHGGHYYMTSLMQDTLQGVIHAFVLNNFLTNTAHWPTRQIFCRILLFYHLGLVEGCVPSSDRAAVHLPDIKSIDGVLNLLSACVLVVLGNVLDFRTYKAPNQSDDDEASEEQASLLQNCDINAIPYNERVASCYARGVAFYVMQWIQACATICGPSGEVVKDFPYRFLVQILQSLQNYKLTASRRRLPGVPHCTYSKLKSQIENILSAPDNALAAAWACRESVPSDSLKLANKERYSISWSLGWQAKWKSPSIDFVALGMTPFDSKYLQALRDHSTAGTNSGSTSQLDTPQSNALVLDVPTN
ncbi:hypothetical protein CPB84DRAFT_1690089 [Gymnopilus junonius]|uniref:Uncharacterized protein n=1 Tax=Gymnopilus junonius TaxID=109634 RepID=A0A9P5TGE5_GYMJU|nr:hypothetical protein CPB84DRAFT_1690089 [Gymnopilus junonius]